MIANAATNETMNATGSNFKMKLPSIRVNVLVQCKGFRCMAYRTDEGKWVSTFTREELKDIIRVISVGEAAGSFVPIRLGAKPRSKNVPIRIL